MAFRHGRLAEVSVNGKLLGQFCDKADSKFDVGNSDTTTFGVTWKTSIPGIAGAQFDISGNYDPTAVTGPAAVLEALIGADAFALIMYPGGNVSGQRTRTCQAILTGYSESSAVGDKVGFTASFVATGAVTFGVVA